MQAVPVSFFRCAPKTTRKHVVVTFNEWINAAGEPMEELPLTVLDTTSFEESVLNTAWFQGGLDSMSLPYSEKMRSAPER